MGAVLQKREPIRDHLVLSFEYDTTRPRPATVEVVAHPDDNSGAFRPDLGRDSAVKSLKRLASAMMYQQMVIGESPNHYGRRSISLHKPISSAAQDAPVPFTNVQVNGGRAARDDFALRDRDLVERAHGTPSCGPRCSRRSRRAGCCETGPPRRGRGSPRGRGATPRAIGRQAPMLS